MNSTPYQLAEWFVYALTGDINTPIAWRVIHDKRKDIPAHNYFGSVRETFATLADYNSKGYGVFASINALDDSGRELANVKYIRSHCADLDNPLTAPANYQQAAQTANFAVQSSPNKFHLYWRVQPYQGNDFYTVQQRKLAQLYDGDKKIIDATRVMRVPGFLHQKNEPVLVTGWQLPNFDKLYSSDEIASMLQHVNVIEHVSNRHPLGTPEMSAPSLNWLQDALGLINPNDLDRDEWLSISAAYKQAGWLHSTDQELYATWQKWCAQYGKNDAGENLKLWNSIKNTETGWATFERRTPIRAYIDFGMKQAPTVNTSAPANVQIPELNTRREFGEILTAEETMEWFKDCYFVERMGQIVSRNGRFMNATQFNGKYGGKQFIISSVGKLTDEPWKAALRSTVMTIPKVDHVRFLPDRPTFEIITDNLGRRGLNTYIPARIDAKPGDITLFLDWFNKILPVKQDQEVLFGYMAHCVKYPGHKIPWAPMLQSTEGIGKTVFREVMAHALGDMYVYSPKAPELVKSGSTFNAWMRGKLMIMVDEIKIDERRELIEILKPMITDSRVEIQSKGVDQDMEDNPANWWFFSNYKDAIPISKNGRRYAIFYSVLQSKADIIAAGMDDAYFNRLWTWLREGGGLQAVAHWLINYPIEKGALPVRAPETSSHCEALSISRTPLEILINDQVQDGAVGFRNGFVSAIMVMNRAKSANIRNVTPRTVQTCLEGMGYVYLGRAERPYFQENPDGRGDIYGVRSDMTIYDYARAQGYS